MISCKKHDNKEPQSSLISGRAFYKNRFAIDSGTLKPLAFQYVFVRNPNDSDDNYFAQTKTDADGNFYINIEKRPVVIFARPSLSVDTNVDAKFYGKLEINNLDASNLKLIAVFDDSKQNGFIIELKDESGDAISNATVWLYNNQALATQNDPSGSIATLSSNMNGQVSKINLLAGNYYLNASKTIDTVIYQRTLKQINITTSGIVQDTMQLKKKVNVNGFTVTVKDSLDGNIPTASIYVYNSQVLASSNDPDGAIKTTHTDSNGVFSVFNLAAGKYYINASKMVDSITYQRLLKQVTLPAVGFVVDTIVVRKK